MARVTKARQKVVTVEIARRATSRVWLFVALFALCAGCGVDEFLDDDKPTAGEQVRGVTCYSSFGSFKRDMKRKRKKPPDTHHWHHIVEQNPVNKKRFPDRLHCTDNLIAVPADIHNQISGHYNSKQPWTGAERVRDVISRRSWEAQYEYGIERLREQGIEP